MAEGAAIGIIDDPGVINMGADDAFRCLGDGSVGVALALLVDPEKMDDLTGNVANEEWGLSLTRFGRGDVLSRDEFDLAGILDLARAAVDRSERDWILRAELAELFQGFELGGITGEVGELVWVAADVVEFFTAVLVANVSESLA